MTANIRCYDPATGQITFDINAKISRLLGVIDGSDTQGKITVANEVIGGGTLFWYLANPMNYMEDVDVRISNNEITYKKKPHHQIVYGVFS